MEKIILTIKSFVHLLQIWWILSNKLLTLWDRRGQDFCYDGSLYFTSNVDDLIVLHLPLAPSPPYKKFLKSWLLALSEEGRTLTTYPSKLSQKFQYPPWLRLRLCGQYAPTLWLHWCDLNANIFATKHATKKFKKDFKLKTKHSGKIWWLVGCVRFNVPLDTF